MRVVPVGRDRQFLAEDGDDPHVDPSQVFLQLHDGLPGETPTLVGPATATSASLPPANSITCNASGYSIKRTIASVTLPSGEIT